jgi:multidrug efflux pump subunit AcrA (membrane-fusion protein)
MTRILSLVAALMLSGCASQLNITYYSDPPGAVLYSEGQRVGYTPQTLYYDVSEETKKRGFMNLAAAKVQWASGATAEMQSLKVDLAKFGLSQKFTFNRPNGVPGREADERFSLELDRTRAIQRQAEAQEEQAAAQRRQAEAQEEQAATQRRQAAAERNRQKNCSSAVIGNKADASCH